MLCRRVHCLTRDTMDSYSRGGGGGGGDRGGGGGPAMNPQNMMQMYQMMTMMMGSGGTFISASRGIRVCTKLRRSTRTCT